MLPKVSVIVCTKNRPRQLKRCLKSLVQLKYNSYEIIVVDNNSSGEETKLVASRFPVRYFLEKKPGQPSAANRGIREARGEIVALTDDDCVVEANWLNLLTDNFKNPAVGCCTGLVLPLELKTKPQRLFNEYWGFYNRTQKEIFTKKSKNPFSPINPFKVGDGTNMSFRKVVLSSIGYFDEELDVGAPGKSGGEIFAFFQVLDAGWKIVYEPRAIVWHFHRPAYRDLIKKMYANGFSCYSHLKKCMEKKPKYKLKVILYMLIWLPYQPLRLSQKFLKKPRFIFPFLGLVEIVGFLRACFYWTFLKK